MDNILVKHVVKCMVCDFSIIFQDYDDEKEKELLELARKHCKETEHTVMTQT